MIGGAGKSESVTPTEVAASTNESVSPKTEIAIAVIEHAGHYLIGVRPAGAPLEGLWEFPGGKVAAGESPAEAATREAKEETGLDVVVGDRCELVEHQYEHGSLRLHFFPAYPRDPSAVPDQRFRWVGATELSRLEFPAANRAIIDRLCRGESLYGSPSSVNIDR